MPAFELVANYTTLARRGVRAVEFENRIIFAGGYDGTNYLNDVWASQEGVKYTELTTGTGSFSKRSNFGMVVHDNRIFVIGGYNGSGMQDVWSSPDGNTWTQISASARFGARHDFMVYSYNGYIWVMGGYGTAFGVLRDCWNSRDGVNWNLVGSNNNLCRGGAAYCVYDNKMWFATGYGGVNSALLRDCWYTVDGSNFVQTESKLPAVMYASMTKFDSKMVLIGGDTTSRQSTASKNLWYSHNGSNWIDSVSPVGFSVIDHAALAFTHQQRMYVLMGYDGAAYKGNIWKTLGVEFRDRTFTL